MSRRLWLGWSAALLLLGPGFAQADSVPEIRKDRFESGCYKGCTRESDDFDYCRAYCRCLRRDIFSARSRAEIDLLYTAMRPDAPESPQKQQLEGIMNACIEEVDAP